MNIIHLLQLITYDKVMMKYTMFKCLPNFAALHRKCKRLYMSEKLSYLLSYLRLHMSGEKIEKQILLHTGRRTFQKFRSYLTWNLNNWIRIKTL